MTTRGSSAAGSGQGRGRGLDALFEESRAAPPPATGIDAELAAMLDEEVRAGAPTIDSLETSVSRGVAAPAGVPFSTVRDITQPAGRGLLPGATTTGMATPALEEGIDTPLPVSEALKIETPDLIASLPSAPQPVTLPSATASAIPLAPAKTAGSTQATAESPQTPIRIGAVIIDSTPASAGSGKTSPDVNPAGELIPVEQPSAEVITTAAAGVRDVLPPGPGVRPTPQPMPTPQQLAEDQKTIVINRLDSILEAGWQKALHKEIDDLYKRVATEFSSPPSNSDQMLTMLQEARQILVESPENYVATEYRMAQVRSMISRTTESRRQSARYGPRMLIYEVIWLALFLVGIVFGAPLAEFFTRSGNIAGATANDVFPFWNTLMWGGIGGIIGALYALWWHISDQQDFDRQYLMWYLVQPIMGLVLGGIVFLLLSGGFLLLQIKPADANAGARLLPYLVAVLAGFRQNFIYEQFDRLISLFAPPANQGNSQ